MQTAAARFPLLISLTSRPFALLWSGQTLSRIGDYLYQIALAWWVLQTTGSAVAMGTVLICSFSPMLLFLLLGGVAGDRFPRVRVMVTSDLLRGVLVSGVAVLALTHRLVLWQVYGASLLFGFVDAFFQPAYSAVLPELVPATALPSANALTSMSTQTGRILGPALGAAIVAAGGTATAFALDGLSFFVSAACLVPLLSRPAPERGAGGAASVLRDVRDALGTVLAWPWLWLTILVYALTNVTLGGPYGVALPFLVRTHFHGQVGLLGFLYACFPAGYVLADVWLGRRARLRRRGLLVYGGLLGAGLGMLALGLPVPVLAAALAAAFNGAALEASNLGWLTTMQERIPSAQLGRVSSMDMLGSFVLQPVGYGVTGWATDQWGAATVVMLGGGCTVVLALVGLAHPAVRRLD